MSWESLFSGVKLGELEKAVAPILGGATFLAATATAAMALVEFAKALTRTRLFFHRWSLRRWTAQKPRDAWSMPLDIARNLKSRGNNIKAENEILSELIILAAGGHDYAQARYDSLSKTCWYTFRRSRMWRRGASIRSRP